MLGGVDVPQVRASDPPAFAIPEECDAVDAAAFYLAIGGRTAFCGAEHVYDVTCALRDAMNFAFVKGFAAHGSLAHIHKFLVAHGYGGGLAGSVFAGDNEADVGNVKSGIAIPLTRLSAGRKRLRNGFDHAVDGGNVFGRGAALRWLHAERVFWDQPDFRRPAEKQNTGEHQRAEQTCTSQHEVVHDLMVPDPASHVTAACRK